MSQIETLQMKSSGRIPWSSLFLLWTCGASLRLTILAVPPVISFIQQDLHLSGTEVGLLSGIPVILFAEFELLRERGGFAFRAVGRSRRWPFCPIQSSVRTTAPMVSR
jgi:cyanate permease